MSNDDAQLKIMAVLPNLAGKIETNTPVVSTQSCMLSASPSSGDKLASHQAEVDDAMNIVFYMRMYPCWVLQRMEA